MEKFPKAMYIPETLCLGMTWIKRGNEIFYWLSAKRALCAAPNLEALLHCKRPGGICLFLAYTLPGKIPSSVCCK